MRSEGTSKERLKISLEAVERDDDVLMSPCASVGSSSASKEEAFVERAPGDSVTSSTGSPWSTVSSVGETKREVGVIESHTSSFEIIVRSVAVLLVMSSVAVGIVATFIACAMLVVSFSVSPTPGRTDCQAATPWLECCSSRPTTWSKAKESAATVVVALPTARPARWSGWKSESWFP